MPFDIKRSAEFEEPGDEFCEYKDELLDLFADSPEGKACLQENESSIFWAGSVIEYGFSYVGSPLHKMNADLMEELLTEIFPRKISLSRPDDADNGLPGMIAFWEYLKREYQLSNADNILRYLRAVKPKDFKEWMNDSSRFGMAKSFFAMGQASGFDMSSEEGLANFTLAYNANLRSPANTAPIPGFDNLLLGSGFPFDLKPIEKSKKERDRARHKRKTARSSRKKNRQRK